MTFASKKLVELVARELTAADCASLSRETQLELAEVHRERREFLSAMQYEELAERKETKVGVVQG